MEKAINWVALIGLWIVTVGIAHMVGYEKGYVAPRPKVPPLVLGAVDIDKQCAAWLFDTNLVEAKKRICKGK